MNYVLVPWSPREAALLNLNVNFLLKNNLGELNKNKKIVFCAETQALYKVHLSSVVE
jgi:hypothetical protein